MIRANRFARIALRIARATKSKHYGRVSESPCFPWENFTGNLHNYDDSKLLRRSIFSTAGSFGSQVFILSGTSLAKIGMNCPRIGSKLTQLAKRWLNDG